MFKYCMYTGIIFFQFKGYCTHTLDQLKYIHTWGILFPLAPIIIHFMYFFKSFKLYPYRY